LRTPTPPDHLPPMKPVEIAMSCVVDDPFTLCARLLRARTDEVGLIKSSLGSRGLPRVRLTPDL
jgi:hypothetical protein